MECVKTQGNVVKKQQLMKSADSSNPLPAGQEQLRDAAEHLQEKRLPQAEQLLRSILKDNPGDPNALRMLAEIGMPRAVQERPAAGRRTVPAQCA